MHRIPKTVRAAAIEVFGPPDAMSLHLLPVLETGDDKLLFALRKACSGHQPSRMAPLHDPTRLPAAPAAIHELEGDRLALERLKQGHVVSVITLSIV